jgi:hypothetical protein
MSRLFRLVVATAAVLGSVAGPLTVAAQERGAPARKILSIGHYPRVDGIRINYRDRELDLVRGANITIWSPYEDYIGGTVKGAAIGLPITMAEEIRGLGFGLLGVGATDELRGIALAGAGVGAGGALRGISIGGIGVGAGGSIRGAAIGGIGVGAGGDARGLMVGGIGAAAGGSVRGITVAGIGAGAGGDVRGMMVAGIGAGAGGSVRGMTVAGLGVGAGGSVRGMQIAGLGVGAGGSVRGIQVGGLGVGAGGSVRGLTVAGLGAGAGGDVDGITVAGLGVGSGGTLRWLSVAGLGLGASRIEGAAAALVVGTEDARGVIIAPALFRTERGGRITGATVSSVNAVRGYQHGISIGLVNYAERLKGLQIGAVNIVRDNPAPFRVLPIINFGSGR